MNEQLYARRLGVIQYEDGSRTEFTVQLDRHGLEKIVRRALRNKNGQSNLGPLKVSAISLDAEQAKRLLPQE
jgi:hypothetical protein